MKCNFFFSFSRALSDGAQAAVSFSMTSVRHITGSA
jgi:hypothetical protein